MSTRAADQWFFDSWSRGYDVTIAQRLAYRPVHDAVLQALNPAARRVLDVGCGTGELARRIRAERLCLKPEYIRIEFSAMIPGLQAGRLGSHQHRHILD